ncbi:hypothetical protein NEOLEDRAFT_1061540, partial [Neolentinus lepideus HHB14362 ss-1]
WYDPSFGLLLACCNGQFKSTSGHLRFGDARLYCILITESMHMIWKLRCERVIQNEGAPFDPAAVRNRWIAAMNRKVNLDCLMTNTKRYKKRATPPARVTAMWANVLHDEDNLPPNWARRGGVLVGITRDQVARGVG